MLVMNRIIDIKMFIRTITNNNIELLHFMFKEKKIKISVYLLLSHNTIKVILVIIHP